MKKKITHFLASWGFIILIGFFFYIIFRIAIDKIPEWYKDSYHTIQSKNEKLTPQTTSYISNTFSAILGPLIAILAAYLTFIAFWIQYRANKIQSNYIKQQRFEDTFFRLLDTHKRNVETMDIRNTSDSKLRASGNDCFKFMYDKFKTDVKEVTDISAINSEYDKIQDYYKNDLHHYFRFLYHTLKFIKHADISDDDKYKYSSILRATLSPYELHLIFHNGLHYHGNTHFKPLIEYFSFLKNMDRSLLFNENQISQYDDLAFSNSSERKALLKDWIKKEKK